MSFGRLERTPPPQPFSDINVTPLVDVMLVLVVIGCTLVGDALRDVLSRRSSVASRARASPDDWRLLTLRLATCEWH